MYCDKNHTYWIPYNNYDGAIRNQSLQKLNNFSYVYHTIPAAVKPHKQVTRSL